ncbi:hypothetical protein H5410_010758 [Solanum commersonii]|uniref:Secreted protein n=1 Tax=Solanum commersonii TaxID=4109 RepID=A0A9J6AMF7_SOLCO|nr:hypothetical protein H5410_010758 [Solanum commersonii]
MRCVSFDLFLFGTLLGFQKGSLSASPNKRIICTAGLLFGKMTEDDPAETKLGMLFSSSPRQTEDPSGPETTTPTSSLWSS